MSQISKNDAAPAARAHLLSVLVFTCLLCSLHASAGQETLATWLEDYLQEIHSEGDTVGVSAAIVLPDGEILTAVAGAANQQGDPLDANSRFLGGSTGKTYVAALTLRLAEQGRLAVSAPVASYLGDRDWFTRIPNAGDITIHQLLNHTSGLPHYIDDYGFMASFAWDRLLGNDTAYRPEQMLGFIFDESPVAPAGTTHYYSDLNYFLLGLVIEAVTGESYYEVLDREILKPQGLDDVLPQVSREIPGLVSGHADDSLFNRVLGTAGPTMEDGRLKLDPSLEWTGGGLATTPRGLAMFFHALGSGAIVSPAALQSMAAAAVAVAPASATGYGYGFFVSEREHLGRYYSHAGWYPGYVTNAAWFADGEFSVAIQFNKDHGVDIYTPLRDIAAAVVDYQQQADSETRLDFDLISAGEKVGSQTVRYLPDGRVDIHYEFATQGKQPFVDVSVDRDPAGLPRQMQRRGKAYLYHDIDERFETDGPRARWRSRTESGESTDFEGHYYVPFDLLDSGASAPAETALLAAALLRDDDHSLPLLPAGEASIEILARSRVTDSSQPDRVVQLVALRGLTLNPTLLWLDPAGRPFAELGPSDIYRSGRGPGIESLRATQAAAEAASRLRMHRSLSASVNDSRMKPIVIRGAMLFDANDGRLTDAVEVRIDAGRISAVRKTVDAEGADFIDAQGHTLLPGLWDMHVHLSESAAPMHLAAGVTTVRDLANNPDSLDALRQQLDSGELHGPRVLRAGYIDRKGPLQSPTGRLVESVDEALAAVDEYAERDYRQIKLYGAIAPEWVAPIAARAHQQGLRLSGHIPIEMTTREAIEAGYDEVNHFVFMWLNFSDAPVPLQLTFNTARIAGRIPHDSPEMRDLVRLFADRDVALDPTLAVYEEFIRGISGEMYPAYRPFRHQLPLQTRRQSTAGPLQVPADLSMDTYRDLFTQALALVGEMDEAGVQILAGTDHRGLPGLVLARELELLHEAGIARQRVLQLATLEAARLMGMEDQLGSIESGKLADMVLVKGDPTTDLGALRNVSWVIKDGRAYPGEALREAAGLQTPAAKRP